MTMQEQPPREMPRRPTPVRRLVPVVRIEQLAANMRRVTFGGVPAMEGFSVGGPAEHMKVYFPGPGQEVPIAPDFSAPPQPGQPRPIGRTYTPRRWRPDAMELDIDFIMHGEGPGSVWARNAAVGGLVILSEPKSAYAIDASVGRYVIGGDTTAIPAIGTILEALPASARADVYIEIEDESEEQALDTKADVQLTWLPRAHGTTAGAQVRDAIQAAKLDDAKVFVAVEATAMREVRKYLLLERGLERSQVFTHGYWKQGEANHPDGDRGEEI